ncbi:MAG: DUF2231 domain-containing protein [Chloroflexota bacterium]
MTLPALYRLHPIAVHFPIALLALGLAAALSSWWKRRPSWLAEAESWLLWLGTASAWAALGLGLLAEKTAPHVPPAWETLAHHEELAWWTGGVFTALSALKLFMVRKNRSGGLWRAAYLVLWLAGAGLLLETGEHGGELVYEFGMGVGGERHGHEH